MDSKRQESGSRWWGSRCSCLQVPPEYVKQDDDGCYLFPLPATVYVQRLDGQPLDGEHYIQLTINEKGEIKKRIIPLFVAEQKSRIGGYNENNISGELPTFSYQ